jgi:hypothetical protein
MACGVPIFEWKGHFFAVNENRQRAGALGGPGVRVRKYFPARTFAANLNPLTNSVDRAIGFLR